MNRINKFNDRLALKITNAVSTMWMAYFFSLIALASLPATLTLAGVVSKDFFPHWMVSVGLISLVAWVAQTFIQLVLLSVIMVGQKIQADTTIKHVSKTHDETIHHLKKIHIKLGGK